MSDILINEIANQIEELTYAMKDSIKLADRKVKVMGVSPSRKAFALQQLCIAKGMRKMEFMLQKTIESMSEMVSNKDFRSRMSELLPWDAVDHGLGYDNKYIHKNGNLIEEEATQRV